MCCNVSYTHNLRESTLMSLLLRRMFNTSSRVLKRSRNKRLQQKKQLLPDYRNWRQKLTERIDHPQIGVVGAPLVHGQPLSGTNAAPGLLRDSGLFEKLKRKGSTLWDHGDLQFEVIDNDDELVPGCKFAKTVSQANKQIADTVSQVLRENHRCLLLGGDHSVGLGSVFGHCRVRKDVAVIWVDAHADINTPLTSTSGNLHGMPVSFLVKELRDMRPPVPGMEWCKPCITHKQLAYIGLRDVDPAEQVFLDALKICHFTTEDVKTHGIDYVMKAALDRVDPLRNRPIHLSFDVDSLDPEHMPATGTRVPGGLSLREALRLLRLIHNTGRLSVMDIVELNPTLVPKWQGYFSADITVELILKAFTGAVRQQPWEKEMGSARHRGQRWRWRKELRSREEM